MSLALYLGGPDMVALDPATGATRVTLASRSLADPNVGNRTFDYFPLGELKSQANARGQVTSFTYDRLSRLTTRTEPEGTTTWAWGTSVVDRNIGSLAAVSSPRFQESYQYDSYGRPRTGNRSAAGYSMVSQQTYDSVTGLPDVFHYPQTAGTAGLRVRHHYDRGRLVRQSDADRRHLLATPCGRRARARQRRDARQRCPRREHA